MDALLAALASLPVAVLAWLLVIRLAKAKATEVGEEEVSRRIQQGYRVRAVAGAVLLLGGGLGYLIGRVFGATDLGVFAGFGVAAG